MKREHRLGVSELNLVERHLKLEPVTDEQICSVIEEIDQLYGIDEVKYEPENMMLHLTYDASRLCIDSLEIMLQKQGVEVSHDWWTRFKEGYYRFVDQNVQDNKKHTPWSCHKK